jgi:hypothetical protein
VLTTRRVIQARESAAALDRVPLASPQSVNA